MRQSVSLRTGTLTVSMDPSGIPMDELCGFGSRNNPKRGFLFVSRVLGKHLPALASAMLDVHRKLAEKLPHDLAEAVFIGMAETATGLGQGVFEAHHELSAFSKNAYIQTTRYVLDGAVPIKFEEPHSHAVQQFVYMPEDLAARAQLERCHTLILVDDEISTGTTLCNLAAACSAINPGIQRVVVVCLTDFSGGRAADRIRALPGIQEVQIISLASGHFEFSADSQFQHKPAEASPNAVGCRRHLITPYSARLGTTAEITLPPTLVAQCVEASGPRTLVVGTGEFMHAAFCVARALEDFDMVAHVQSTTRSPILLDHDIRSAVVLPDLYGEGVPNFLYNFAREDYDVVLVVHETPRCSDSDGLCRTLAAHSVCLMDHTVTRYHEFA